MLVMLNASQEDVPLVKHYDSHAKCKPRRGTLNETCQMPLHLKNNICKELFIKIWKDLFGTHIFSKFKSFTCIPADYIFCLFVTFICKEMKLNKLAGKMVSWFNETNRGVDRDFKYRFTGQESNAVLKHFPMLISKFILLLNHANIKKRFLRNTFINCFTSES